MSTATLRNLIEALEAADPNLVVPDGFARPHSYRGYYDDLAFEPAENVRVMDMLHEARGAVGSTFTGYKGGEFTMGEYTTVWLADYGKTGETLGPTLVKMMLAAAGHGKEPSAGLEGLREVPVAFGLRQQGKLEEVHRMHQRGVSWETIGKAIGWEPATAREFYEREWQSDEPSGGGV